MNLPQKFQNFHFRKDLLPTNKTATLSGTITGRAEVSPNPTQYDCVKALKPLFQTFKVLGITPISASSNGNIALQNVTVFRSMNFVGVFTLVFLICESVFDIVTILTDGDASTSAVENINGLIYYLHIFLVILIMSRKVKHLPEFIVKCMNAEELCRKYDGIEGKSQDRIIRKMWIIFFLILTAQLLGQAFFCLGIASRAAEANKTLQFEDFLVGINKIDLLSNVGYQYQKVIGGIIVVIELYCDVIWTFGEHLNCAFSFLIASFFARYNQGISKARGETVREIEGFRKDHRQLKDLVDSFNSTFSLLLFVTYMGNLSYLLTRLYIGVARDLGSTSVANIVTSAYASFYLVSKIFVPTWFAAKLHERAHEVLDVVHDWSSAYGTENCNYRIMVINRFVSQLVTDPVCFNGCGYFALTKPFIVTMISGILGYEVIILQFQLASKNASTT